MLRQCWKIFGCLILFGQLAFAVRPDLKTLPIGLTEQEARVLKQRGLGDQQTMGTQVPPAGVIHSLGEWEEATEVMTLWTNPAYIKALSDHGRVRLLADSDSEMNWWKNWLTTQKQGINTNQFSYFIVPTDSIWVRDYGPWPIVDSKGKFGLIDNIYNRPRPQDDKVPDFIGQALNLPVYKTGLVHTGGNYYSDGMGSAFSSTLVFTENPKLSKNDIFNRMLSFLGIQFYVTSQLSPGITIEHLDTFGKLVAPDTWVFSQFAVNSRHYADSEAMVALLKTLKSPYGTPYKILRMKMTNLPGSSGENYRAYLNSFISNGALFFPTYGDNVDEIAKSIYQQALPGYQIVGVENGGTEWGDSVHCRSRNLINPNTTFIFPHVAKDSLKAGENISISAEIYAAPGAELQQAIILWSVDAEVEQALAMTPIGENRYAAQLPSQKAGAKISFYIETQDSMGRKKTAPIRAPAMKITAEIL